MTFPSYNKYNLNLIAPSGYSPIHKIEQSTKIWKSMGNSIDDIQVESIKHRISLRFGGNELQRENDLYLDNIYKNHSINA